MLSQGPVPGSGPGLGLRPDLGLGLGSGPGLGIERGSGSGSGLGCEGECHVVFGVVDGSFRCIQWVGLKGLKHTTMTIADDDNAMIIADDDSASASIARRTTSSSSTIPRKSVSTHPSATVDEEPVVLWINYDATRPIFSSPCLLLLPR